MKLMSIVVVVLCMFAGLPVVAHAAEDADEPVNFIELVGYRGGNPEAVFYFEKEIQNGLVLYVNGATTKGLKEFAIAQRTTSLQKLK